MNRFAKISTALLSLFLATSSLAQAPIERFKATASIKPVKSATVVARYFNPLINEAVDQPKRAPEEGHSVVPNGPKNSLTSYLPFNRGRISSDGATKFPAVSFLNGEPPDCELAVGTNSIVVAVNSAIAVFDKRGRKLFQQNFRNFFASVNPASLLYDPKVIYDVKSGRYFLVTLALNDPRSATGQKISSVLFAVSNTSDPLGAWTISKYDSKQTINGVNYWFDYPGFGISDNKVAVSGNMFPFDGESGSTFATVLSFDKATLSSGTATGSQINQSDAFTIQFCKPSGNTSTTIYGAETVTTSTVRLYALTGTDLVRTTVNIPQWPNFGSRMSSVGRSDLDPSDTRMETAVFRSGSIYATHPRGVSNSDSRVACRWYEFRTNNWPTSGAPSLAQTGDILPPSGEFYSYPAININGAGSVGLCFSRMSPSVVADVMAAGRRTTDPVGRVSTPVTLESSLASRYVSAFDNSGLSVYRWGDYYDVEVDPTDDRTFWVIGMGAGLDGKWQTFVRSFAVQEPINGFLSLNALSTSIFSGSILSGDTTALFAEDRNVLNVRSEPVRGSGQSAGITAVYKITSPAAAVQTLRIQSKLAGPAGSTGFLFLKNQSSGQYESVDSFALNPAGSLRNTDVAANSIARYISSNGEITMLMRSLLPIKSGQMPSTFSMQIDLGRIQIKEAGF